MVGIWERSWPEFVPFLDFPVEIRKPIHATSGIDSLNARSALNLLYPHRPGTATEPDQPHRPDNAWKSILNTLAITYGDRPDIS